MGVVCTRQRLMKQSRDHEEVNNGDHKCKKKSQAGNYTKKTIPEGNESTTDPAPEEIKASPQLSHSNIVHVAHPAWNIPKAQKNPFQKRKFMSSKRRATTLQPTTDGRRSPIFTIVMALVMGVVTMIRVTKGGKASRVVNCVLAIKSYDEWKQSNENGICKFGGSIKSPSLGKSSFVRKYSNPFMNSLLRTSSINNEKSPSNTASNKLVRAAPRNSTSSLNNISFHKPLGEIVREEKSFKAVKKKKTTPIRKPV